MDADVREELDKIHEKLDKIIAYQKWEKDEWEDSQSFSKWVKQWGSFYLASLLADETLRRNGSTNSFGTFK